LYLYKLSTPADEGRVACRARRREALQAKREVVLEHLVTPIQHLFPLLFTPLPTPVPAHFHAFFLDFSHFSNAFSLLLTSADESRVARRARRREALQAKREVVLEQRRELRAAVKAAVRAAEEAEAAQQAAAEAAKQPAVA
jgi:hypothetical protein